MILDMIIRTKLQPPRLKGKILHRERLLNLLNENLDKKLVLVCADAGYGKTTFLTQFCEEFNRPFIFYGLDTSDNDIATFFNYIATGLQQHCPDFGQRTKSMIHQTRDIEILTGTFINDFIDHFPSRTTSLMRNNKGERKELRQFYIFLDDYHHLQQNKEIGNALDYLLRHLPENLHFVISSRSTPPLNLAHYYAKQEFFKMGKEQLQFNPTEIQVLLKEVYGLKVPDAEIDRIERHSEGWITAIQLILQKILFSGADKAKETLNGYIVSGEEIFNYFAREVFENLPQEIREFLMKTSILESLEAEVCNYLMNFQKSKRILSFLETENIFISKFQNSNKYHPLFREFLFNMLGLFYTGIKIMALYRRAGSYLAKTGDYLGAASYFCSAGDNEKAAKALDNACQCLSISENFRSILSLLDRLPAAVLYKHPYLCLVKSTILSSTGRKEEALHILFKTKKMPRRKKDRRIMIEILHQLGAVHLFLMRPKKALFYENRAIKLLGKSDSILRTKVLTGMGNINRMLGRYHEAEKFLKQSLTMARKLHNEEIEMLSLAGLARVYSEKTDFNAGIEIYNRLLAKYENKKSRLSYADLCGNAAALCIEVNNFTGGEKLLDLADNCARMLNNQRAVVYTSGIRGKLYLYQNKYQKAIEQYENTLRLNEALNEELVEVYARIDIAFAYLAMNEIISVKCELKKVSKFISLKIPPPVIIDYFLIKGRLNFLEKKIKQAENDLHRALAVAEKYQMSYQKMIILYHLSNLYLTDEDESRTLQHLARCLNIVKQNGYAFFMIREGKTDLKILECALNNNIEPDYVLNVLADVGTPAAKDLLEKGAERQIPYDLGVQLFGRLEIKDGQSRTIEPAWRTRRMKSLFAFLLMAKDTKMTADSLVEKFWPHRGRKDGSHNLHEHMSYLRKILGLMLNKGKQETKSIIVYKNQSYFLNPNINFKIDALEFERLLEQAQKSRSTDKINAIQLCQKALGFYKGDFCSECDDNWSDEKRLYYRSMVHRITKEVGDYYYEIKDYVTGLEYYKRTLEFEPCSESVHILIMHVLSAMGDRVGVLNQYKKLEKILYQKLKTKPCPEAQEMYREHMK